jgi:flagellar hook protein FlgE
VRVLAAINSSLSGMQAASLRAETAASNIANVNVAGAQSTQTRGSAPVSSQQPYGPASDLATDMTNLLMASQDFMANATVLRVTDDMLRSLYDLID